MTEFQLRDPNDIRVAALGAGRMGRVHIANIAAIPGVRIVALADPDPSNLAAGLAIAAGARGVADPLEAVAAEDVDAVVIVTPTSTHAELIEAALRAGKAVWTEKPIAQDLAATARIVDLWRASGLPLQVGFMRRFDPGYVEARRRIDAGEVGRIEQFRAYGRDTYPPPLEFLLTSGGSFLDMTIHDLDLARFLVGEVEEVSAWGAVLFDDRFAQANDFDTSVAMLRFRNGALGVVETSRHSAWGYDIRTEVSGSNAKVVVDPRDQGHHYDSFPERFADAYRLEIEAFFADLAAGRTPGPGPEDALEALRLAVAMTRSWHEGRPIRLDDLETATPAAANP